MLYWTSARSTHSVPCHRVGLGNLNRLRLSTNTQTSYNKTLQFITATKLKELEKQKKDYASINDEILQKIRLLDNPIQKVEILLKAVRSWRGSGSLGHQVDSEKNLNGELNVSNLDELLLQAKSEPGFHRELLENWAVTLETYIKHRMKKFDCAKLFGNLFNEWLSSGDTDLTLTDEGSPADLVNAGRQEMQEQKGRLMSLIFEEKHVDKEGLESYLSSLFQGKENKRALKKLREQIKETSKWLKKERLGEADVKAAIKGLLREGILDEANQATISTFLENATMLKELTSVVGMRLASLEFWSWPAEGTPIQMRRNLNGKYRAYVTPDILDAIMLQHIGVAWQVSFKRFFTELASSKAWRHPYTSLTKQETTRLYLQLAHENKGKETKEDPAVTYGIAGEQEALRREHFFLSPLANSRFEVAGSYVTESGYDAFPSGKGDPMNSKYKLLHLLTIESLLNNAVHGSQAVVCSDLEWFGPSLSHDAILTILKFFGVPEDWLGFFEHFLRAPLYFVDDPTREVRMRRCGMPGNYRLSTLFGEVVLFAMDFAVNQKANGLYLYRLHDDLWLWDANPENCAIAWKEMNHYARLAGLTFNKTKTGSACVGVQQHPDLPEGPIQWGFLRFDRDKGSFIINQADIDLHINELRRQLAATKSVFGWINTYNKYTAFILRNCGGRPAACFGEAHMHDLINTFSRIHRSLFESSPVAYLSSLIEKRFGITGLPEGYFYLPIRNGGLELVNPMIELFAVQRKVEAHKKDFAEALEEDESEYALLGEQWNAKRAEADSKLPYPYNVMEFMGFDEFKALRDSHVEHWRKEYQKKFAIAEPVALHGTPAVMAAMDTWPDSSWNNLTWYYKWIVTLYGAGIVKMFGGLEVVDPDLIPIGMVKLFRGARLKLDQ